MIIGIDASRANKKERTGTEWYSFFVIEELKRLSFPFGNSIKFILYSKDQLQGELGKLPANFQSRILHWPLKFLWTQIRLSWEMQVKPPDVLFVPAHTIPILGRAKTVMTVHDVGFRAYPQLYSWKDILYHRFSIWWASRFAWKIIVPSQFTKNELIKYYGTDAGKIVVIPMGVANDQVDLSSTQSTSPLAPLPSGRGEQKDTLLFIGRLEEKKNILGIIKAFEKLAKSFPKLELILAGRAGYGFEKVDAHLQKSKFKERIKILGYITENQKTELYRQAAVFVFPTFYEGFGLPILEAQACDCPVLTSNYGAAAEVAGDSAALVDPGSADSIAEGIEKIISDENYRENLIERGQANARKYSWEACAKDTLRALIY